MRRFFDTNVLIYSFDRVDARKREIADTLIEEAIGEGEFVVSTQVLAEFYSTAVRTKVMGAVQAGELVRQWSEHHPVPQTIELLLRGVSLQQEHSLNIRDALIVEAAREAQCDLLYTEDLQHARRFGEVEIVNPFLASAHEPRSTYRAKAKRTSAARSRLST